MKKEYSVEEITEALERIYEYLYSSEKEDYLDCTKNARKGHIYPSVRILGYYLQHEV